MSSVMESIIGIVLIVVIGAAVAIGASVLVVRNSANTLQVDRNALDEYGTGIAVSSLLASTERVTGLTVSELLGIVIVTAEDTVEKDGDTIDIKGVAKERLDAMFGPGNYYLDIKPQAKGVNIMFVLDSSPSVKEERAIIKRNMETIRNTINGRINATGGKVSVQVFILPSKTPQCDQFKDLSIPDFTCEQFTSTSLYRSLLPLGWQYPTFGKRTYQEWRSTRPYYDIDSFSSSDWAAGVAAAATRFESNPYMKKTVDINIIFPLSDELATSSKADACYLLTEGVEAFACQLCDNDCPVARAENATNQSIAILKSGTSIVFPIYSVNCDFDYNPVWNTFTHPRWSQATGYSPKVYTYNDYIQQYLDAPYVQPVDASGKPIPDTVGCPNGCMSAFSAGPDPSCSESWCSQAACGGCTNFTPDKPLSQQNICFHTACSDVLRTHMESMADATGGMLFDINNPEEIPANVVTAFEKSYAKFDFHIGFPDQRRERFIYEKMVELPNGKMSKIRLWVYKSPAPTCIAPLPCTTEECTGRRACVAGVVQEECVCS